MTLTQAACLDSTTEPAATQTGSGQQAVGFDWGSDCSAGTGDFSQFIAEQATTTIGDIPEDKRNVRIDLRSAQDVDVQLIDKATGYEIIAWPSGALSGAGKACTTYEGVQYCYSGYNGVDGQLGNEWIEVRGDTNRALVMKAFGYRAGEAAVTYSWQAVDTCNETGDGSFAQYVPRNDVAEVGVIPAGKVNVNIKLVAPADADVQLYDGTIALVQWPSGRLSGSGKQTLEYEGMTIVWSGYNGDGTGLGHEYIEVKGEVSRDLTMKVFGYVASQADVTYSWGDGAGAACTASSTCGAGLSCKRGADTSGACHTRTWCETDASAEADCVGVTPPATAGIWACQEFVCTWSATGNKVLQSAYLSSDTEAQALIDGGGSVTIPATALLSSGDLSWRIVNAMRMAGYDHAGVRGAGVIDGARLLQIDAELVTAEAAIASQAAKLPNFSSISGPDYRDNIPQAYAAHMFVTILELLNAGATQYETVSNECLLANMVPQMCGALVDMGVEPGSTGCKSTTAVLRTNQIIQTPELFGFMNVRREITADEYPLNGGHSSTMSYASTLIHEFVHDLDYRWNNWAPMHAQYDRRTVCSPNFVNFQVAGSPFMFTGGNGNQTPGDFVSEYAAGLSNQNKDYRSWEDVAESVTAYIVLPEYFRLRAASSATLQAKYDYIRNNMFGGVEFENPHLTIPANYVFPTTTSNWNGVNDVQRFRITDIRVKP